MRITRWQMFMLMAEAAARRSTCSRLNVGAVAVHDNRPVSVGYNGAPPGEPHCTGNDCPGRHTGCQRSVHAEENALDHVPFQLNLRDLDLYVTHSPCGFCVERILMGQRVRRVFFGVPYRLEEPLHRLIGKGVGVYQVTPAGFLIQWSTGELLEEPL